jgi:drug/metabolite transporter (DMT)-like permease
MTEPDDAGRPTDPIVRSRPAARRTHQRALLTMLGCTFLWSTAGVGTRFLDLSEGFEIAFWRSLFCAAFVIVTMIAIHRRQWLSRTLSGGSLGWLSGLMWAVMFTCFMIALTFTSVANVLVVMAASPLLAALLGMLVLRESVPLRTWLAIGVAGIGLIWMVREGLSGDGLTGMAIAFAVPVAAALNLVLLKKTGARLDLMPSVLLGALICMAITLPLAWPLTVGARDLFILAALGCLQLALPCMLMVRVAHHLAPHEIALLGLLEVVLGPLWAWIGAGEHPGVSTIQGGALVLGALALNEWLAQRERQASTLTSPRTLAR